MICPFMYIMRLLGFLLFSLLVYTVFPFYVAYALKNDMKAMVKAEWREWSRDAKLVLRGRAWA